MVSGIEPTAGAASRDASDRQEMAPGARKLRDTYAIRPDAPFYQKTFGLWMCIDTWYENGLPRDANLDEFFFLDDPGYHSLNQLGWCEAEFMPAFEEKVIQDRGAHEVVQDTAGRHVLYFKGRRQGFMPEYLDHPVKDMKTWRENVKWRLDPDLPERYLTLPQRMQQAREKEKRGLMIQQNIIGGYMFLRSLVGPEELLLAFYDMPELVHEMMATWLELANAVVSRHQQHVTMDELYLAEDICYNHGPLISPEMIREFLFPYYQQLIADTKARQAGSNRKLYIQIDTDGDCLPVIDLYREGTGMDMLDPFEVASGCDVVKVGRDYPGLIMSGGIDKRILYKDADAIDAYLETILPVLRRRGGYIPTEDHGVPHDVPWQNYLHYRKRVVEYGS